MAWLGPEQDDDREAGGGLVGQAPITACCRIGAQMVAPKISPP
jgi:hypothetical protein